MRVQWSRATSCNQIEEVVLNLKTNFVEELTKISSQIITAKTFPNHCLSVTNNINLFLSLYTQCIEINANPRAHGEMKIIYILLLREAFQKY